MPHARTIMALAASALLAGCFFGNLDIHRERQAVEAASPAVASPRHGAGDAAGAAGAVESRAVRVPQVVTTRPLEPAPGPAPALPERAAVPAPDASLWPPAVASPSPPAAASPWPPADAADDDGPALIRFAPGAFTVAPQYGALLERHADALRADAGRRLAVRAHPGADGDGPVLAARRIEAVMRLLGSYGADPAQLEPLAARAVPGAAATGAPGHVELVPLP